MIVLLTGGTGGAKLVEGMSFEVDPGELLVICNTADDLVVHGLHVSPDLDTVTYTLAGVVDPSKGWGIKDETFSTLQRLGELGEGTWFRLGDKDLATHLIRSRLMGQGLSLTQVTERLRKAFGITAKILPMTDDRVETRVVTVKGEISFQEYFVRDGWSHPVLGLAFVGVERSRPAPGVLESIREAEVVILCPSNPATSIGPILSVPGIREALKETRARVGAVSPIMGQMPFSGPAHKFMSHLGMEVSSFGVANAYRDFLDLILIADEDSKLIERIDALEIQAVATCIDMEALDDKRRLARALIKLL